MGRNRGNKKKRAMKRNKRNKENTCQARAKKRLEFNRDVEKSTPEEYNSDEETVVGKNLADHEDYNNLNSLHEHNIGEVNTEESKNDEITFAEVSKYEREFMLRATKKDTLEEAIIQVLDTMRERCEKEGVEFRPIKMQEKIAFRFEKAYYENTIKESILIYGDSPPPRNIPPDEERIPMPPRQNLSKSTTISRNRESDERTS